MKRTLLKTQFIVLLYILMCNTTFAQWSNVNPVNAFPRYRETTFVIGDTAYLGNGDPYTTDFRKYTQNSNTWVEMKPYPDGQGGDQGFNFTINDTAYVGDGADGGYHNDFYCYTPSTGWSAALTTPPGGPRWLSSGFTLGDKGYFGTGLYGTTVFSDFYEYDPTSGWTTKASLPIARSGGIAFSVNGKGYMGLGYKDNTTSAVLNDMYQYDPVANTWTAMASLPTTVGMGEAEPAYFVLCGKLILTSGQILHNGVNNGTNQTWMFDPSNGPTGTWTRLAQFPGIAAYSPQGFAMGDTGFVYGGDDNGTGISQMWRYVPTLVLTPALAADTVVCPGTSVTLNASGGATYTWSTAAGSFSTTGIANYDSTSSIIVAPTATTTYYYTATGNPCYNLDSIVIKVKASSTLTVEPQSPRACNGQSVALTVPTSGTNYTWRPSTTLNASTGDTVLATPTITTVYTVTGNDSVGCAATGIDSVYVVTAPPLIVQPQSPKVCNGQGVTLYAPTSGTGYTWSSSAAITSSGDSATATPTVTTTYSVTGTDSVGCVATGTDSVYVITAPELIIQPQGPQSVCPEQSIALSVPVSGSDYNWLPSATLKPDTGDTVLAYPVVQTTYTVSGIDSLGCLATSDSEVVSVSNAPNKPTITVSGDVLTSSATQGNQWVRNDSILTGATGENYTATIPGWYQVIAENPANGCSTTSDSVDITSGINQLSVISGQLSIYPNPTGGEIFINISSSAGDIRDWYLQITDVLGRTVYAQLSLNYSNAIDLSNLASGVYFISVMNKAARAVVPVVKQ